MQSCFYKSKISLTTVSVIILTAFILLSSGCRNTGKNRDKNQAESSLNQIPGEEDLPKRISFRTFRNVDSTWGYTIFINSRPFLLQNKIPVPGAGSGFQTKRDAENVAGIMIKMIQNGNLNPKLNRKVIDSLGIHAD